MQKPRGNNYWLGLSNADLQTQLIKMCLTPKTFRNRFSAYVFLSMLVQRNLPLCPFYFNTVLTAEIGWNSVSLRKCGFISCHNIFIKKQEKKEPWNIQSLGV